MAKKTEGKRCGRLRFAVMMGVVALAGAVLAPRPAVAQMQGLVFEIKNPNELTRTLEKIMEKVRKSTDANGDGWLQLDEAPASFKPMFPFMDVNRDGTIDATDAQAHQKRTGLFPGIKLEDPDVIWKTMLTPMIASMQVLDKNNDMKISFEEVMPIHRSMFGLFDLNGDQSIDAGDVEAEVDESVFELGQPQGFDPVTMVQDVEFLNQWFRNILDTDRSGVLDAGEIPRELVQLRGLFDVNFDGRLDQGDVVAWEDLLKNVEDRIQNAEATTRDIIDIIISMIDTNMNGSIDRHEFPDQMGWMFDMADVNRDELLNREDMYAAQRNMEEVSQRIQKRGRQIAYDMQIMGEIVREEIESAHRSIERDIRKELRQTRRQMRRTEKRWKAEAERLRKDIEAQLRAENKRLRDDLADMLDRIADDVDPR